MVLDAAGRPGMTLWTQVTALCLTPVAVVVGAQWGLEGVAVGFVLAQLIAVEIPSLFFVLQELRITLWTVIVRLRGVATAALLMAIACLGWRLGLAELGVDKTGRAVLTIALGLLVYATALRFLAPEIYRRGAGLMKPGFARMLASAPLKRRA